MEVPQLIKAYYSHTQGFSSLRLRPSFVSLTSTCAVVLLSHTYYHRILQRSLGIVDRIYLSLSNYPFLKQCLATRRWI